MAAASYYNDPSLLQTPPQPAPANNSIPLHPMNYGYDDHPPQSSTDYNSQLSEPLVGKPHNSPKSPLSKWKKFIRIAGLLTNVVSAMLSLAMEVIMIYVLIKFYKTKDKSGAGRDTPWALSSKLWPTYMLAAASLVTLLITFWAVFAFCFRKAKRGNTKLWTSLIKYGTHVVVWIVVAIIYRVEKRTDDLWGWSCSDKAEAIQEAFKSDLDFSRLCGAQSSSWYISIAEVVLKILFALVVFFFTRKRDENAGWSLARDIVGAAAEPFDPTN